MKQLILLWTQITTRLQTMGDWIPLFLLRAIMAWEFWESGREKYLGENWFANVQMSFPFPFSVVPANVSWHIATWFELIGAVALLLGLGTRFFAFSLMFLTFVATAAVHWPDMWSMVGELIQGYAVTNRGFGNFKLPLLFVMMLIPLVFLGPGKLSLDHLLARYWQSDVTLKRQFDALAIALAFFVLGFPFLMLIPKFGLALCLLALAVAGLGFYRLRASAA